LGQHKSIDCRVTNRCQKCGRKHHTTIHNRPTNINTDQSTEPKPVNAAMTFHSTTSCVLLATAQVKVLDSVGNYTKVRALIDPGSEISLVTERLVQQLRLTRRKSSIQIIGIGQLSNKTKGIVNLHLKPHFTSDVEEIISAHILNKLTTLLPLTRVTERSWPHLRGIELADPRFSVPGSIDIILGADIYGQIIQKGILRGPSNSPIAQNTVFGWIISGPTSSTATSDCSRTYHVSIQEDLYYLMQRFWNLEEFLPQPLRTCLPKSKHVKRIFKKLTPEIHTDDI